MESKEIVLSFKQYNMLERSLRGSLTLSQKLCMNQPFSKNELILELLKEIRSLELDEGDNIPLGDRMYEDGRNLLKTITEMLYPNEADKYIGYLAKKKLVNLHNLEPDMVVIVKVT